MSQDNTFLFLPMKQVGVLVTAARLDSRGSRVRTPLWHSSLKETHAS